jgi:hypothetical protein
MDSVLNFLNQPIVLTLVTLAIGSYLLDRITERRARDEREKQQAIEFITEAANNINRFIPHIYGPLRSGIALSDQAMDDALKELMSSRMSVQIGSQAYLKSDEFFGQYFRVLDQIVDVVMCIRELNQDDDTDQVVEKIRMKREQFLRAWPMDRDRQIPERGSPIDELILWMDMVMERTSRLMVTNLKAAMK